MMNKPVMRGNSAFSELLNCMFYRLQRTLVYVNSIARTGLTDEEDLNVLSLVTQTVKQVYPVNEQISYFFIY